MDVLSKRGTSGAAASPSVAVAPRALSTFVWRTRISRYWKYSPETDLQYNNNNFSFQTPSINNTSLYAFIVHLQNIIDYVGQTKLFWFNVLCKCPAFHQQCKID